MRRKNSTGSRYSAGPSPRLACWRSAANSACWVPAAGDVLVRRHHLAPRLQGHGRALDGEAGLLAAFAARLLVVADAQQLHLELLDVGGLWSRDGGQQPVRGVERAVGVVSGEGLLMGPVVSVVAQLADEVALGPPEDRTEHVVPRLPHQLEERRDVPLGRRLVADQWVVDEPPQRGGVDPLRLDRRLNLAVDEGAEPRLEQIERLADPFVIGCRHVVRSLDRRAPCSPARQALGVVAGSSELRGGEVVRLHGDGFGGAPALPGASCSAFDRRRMFDIFGNGGVQPPHNLHKRAPAGNSSARRAPHLAHHAAAVGRTCGPPARPGSEGVMCCSTAVRRLFEPAERLTRRPAGP